MWNLSSDDVARAKQRIVRQRADLEMNYQKQLKALDAVVAEIETVERVAAEFSQKHLGAEMVVEAGPSETAAATEPEEITETVESAEAEEVGMTGGEAKSGSRWRLHLGNRAAE